MSTPSEPPPPLLAEAQKVNLTVTVHTVEGLTFLTELGAQQVGISILFPSHTLDSLSPLVSPAPRITFDFTEVYAIQFYLNSTVNALLASPLEFYLYVCTPDMKKQAQVARFIFPFDQLFFHLSVSQSVEGKVLPDGASVLSPDGIRASVECGWSEPVLPPEHTGESMIASFSISGVYSIPLCMINCTTQPNNAAAHIFSYTLFAEMPDHQILLLEEGKFSASAPDASDACIQFNGVQKFYVSPVQMDQWKDSAECGGSVLFFPKPELSEILQPLGIGVSELPLAHFAKPDRSHFQSSLALRRDADYADHSAGAPLLSSSGFPREAPEASAKKKGPAWPRRTRRRSPRRTRRFSRSCRRDGLLPGVDDALAHRGPALACADSAPGDARVFGQCKGV
jgi:hypothetical protein